MANAKQEFLEHIKGKELICAKIGVDKENWGQKPDYKILKPDWNTEDFTKFCDELNFNYDSGYGSQELFGKILFKDSFSCRREYDGSEWWENYKMPTIKDIIN